MKHLFLPFAFMLMASVAFSQQSWYPQNSGTSSFLFDVHFTSHTKGWVSGTTGLILHTEDGGANWADQDALPNNAYYGLHFADDLTGWAVGYAGAIIHTSDGGESWSSQASGASTYLYDVFFLDENTGWIVGGDNGDFPTYTPYRLILHTSNGGDTWSPQVSASDEEPLLSVHFTDELHGWATGEGGSILHSQDGGASWTEQMTDLFYSFFSVYFASPQKGWVVGQYLGLPHVSVIFSTTNGGSSWQSTTFEEDDVLSDIFFVDESTGWAVGGSALASTVLKTSDGGESWNPQDGGTTKALYSVFFVNGEYGWAVGYDGIIISTTLASGVVNNSSPIEMNVYPNPNSGLFTIDVNSPGMKQAELMIYNSAGQAVYRFTPDTPGVSFQQSVNLENFSEGVYTVVLKNDQERIVRKFVKLR